MQARGSSGPGGAGSPSEGGGIRTGNLLGLPCGLQALPVLPREPCLEGACGSLPESPGSPSGVGAAGALLGEPSEEPCRVRELPLSAVLVMI